MHATTSRCSGWCFREQERAEDYVIATGLQFSVRDFVTMAAACLDIHLQWKGAGLEGQAYDQYGESVVAVDPRYLRPAEVDTLLGDPTKARKQLGWSPRIDFRSLVEEMALQDLKAAERDALVTRHGPLGLFSFRVLTGRRRRYQRSTNNRSTQPTGSFLLPATVNPFSLFLAFTRDSARSPFFNTFGGQIPKWLI